MPVPVVKILEAADYDGEIARAAELLRKGDVIILPTDTVYGAAAVLNNPAAVAKLQTIRGTNDGKPLTIHLGSPESAGQYLGEVSHYARRIIGKLWPGPVGLIFDVSPAHRSKVAAKLGLQESDLFVDGTITLRCPDHLIAGEVLDAVDAPVVITAASGANAEKIAQSLDGKASLILDAGATPTSKPSTLLRVHANRYEIVRAGVYDERIIERMLRTTVLFVCSGNTCRSPMAEAIARKLLGDKLGIKPDELELRGYSVLSAGSFAMPGARATDHAVDAVRELGGDLSRHRSRPLSVELIHQADQIYTMGRSHLGAVLGMVPGAQRKAATLDPKGDIEDPIGGDSSLYVELAEHLKELIATRLDEMIPPAGSTLSDAKGK